MTTYNGHKDWDYWNVSLWIGNDEGLYRLMLDCIEVSAGDHDKAADAFLETMKREKKTKTPDGAVYTKDNVLAAIKYFD